MPITRPFADLQSKTSEIVDLCFQNEEPIRISCDGDREIIIVSGKQYKEYGDMMTLFEQLVVSERQFLQGEALDFKKAIRQIRGTVCD